VRSSFVPVLIVTALGGLLAGARLALRRLAPLDVPEAIGAVATSPDSATPPRVDSVVSHLVARDPFRIGRRPSALAYDPLRLAAQQAPPVPQPALVLVGLVAGADPTSVIQGLPGVDGPRVLRVGEQVAGIKVRKMAGDTVWLVGLDTTWVLRLKEPR
jgi:hypothetical protein